MMSYSFWARVIGLIRGHSVVAVFSIVGTVYFGISQIPDWRIKVFLGFLIASPALASAIRAVRGTEEGSTDVEITRDGVRMLNIPQAAFLRAVDATVLAGLQIIHSGRPRPLPHPVGIVRGNPANANDLIVDGRASLPEYVEVADQPSEPPADATNLP